MEDLIEQAVALSLNTLRANATQGSTSAAINRVTGRILNSFEENRTQTRTFGGVQNTSTMSRYAAQWSDLVLFLLKLAESHESCQILATRYLRHLPIIKSCMERIQTRGDSLLAANTKQFSLEDCSREFAVEEGEDSKENTKPLAEHAREFMDAIDRLSFALVRYNWHGSAFASPVIGFVALHTVNEEGAWIRASHFSSPLSGWIHCMQLWLLGYCLQASRQQQGSQANVEQMLREQCALFLKNSVSSPISELSWWRLLCWTASNDSVLHPVTTVNEDCTQVTHRSVQLDLETWRQGLRSLLGSASQICEETLLLGLHEAPDFAVDNLVDNPADLRPGKCFLDDPRNELHAVQGWLFDRVQANPSLTDRFFGTDDNVKLLRQSAANQYLLADQRFLRLISVLIYWTSGLPPRCKELVGTAWCNQESPRNLYLSYGLVVLITGYHKSEWRIGTRPIARFLSPAVGHLLVRYLIYVPRFVRFLQSCTQSVSNPGFLFWDRDHVWSADQFGTQHKRQSALVLSTIMTTRDYRHIAIAVDRRLLHGEASKLYGVRQNFEQRSLHAGNLSDSELDAPFGGGELADAPQGPRVKLHSWQASHAVSTNQTSYGNDVDLHAGMTDPLLAAYRQVSQSWHRSVARLPVTLAAASSHKRLPSRDASALSLPGKRHKMGSRLKVRRDLWKWPVIEAGLQRIFGPHAAPRSLDQRHGLIMIARSRPETVVVMPTGGGKTLLFVVPSLLPGAQVTLVIVPLVALRQDLLRRCREWNVACACYDADITPQRMHAVPGLLLVDIETAVTPDFLAFARSLHAMDRLDRIVLDEAHLLLTAGHYRRKIVAVGVLRRIPCPFVCMTATLPPFAELEMKTLLHFTQCDTLRASSDRPNLEYRVQWLDAVRGASRGEKELVEEAAKVCLQDLQEWRAARDARGICYVRTKAMGTRMAESLQCDFYHGGLAPEARQEMNAAWSGGTSGKYLVATAAFNAGVHYLRVRRILHVDAPDGLVNYGQETGRAGRDGLHAVCLVLLPTRWKVSWDQGYSSDFLALDRRNMTAYLQARTCLRRQLTAYLDGALGTACTLPPVGMPAACSVCSPPRSARSTAGVHPTSLSHAAPLASASPPPPPRMPPASSPKLRRAPVLSALGPQVPERSSHAAQPRRMQSAAVSAAESEPFGTDDESGSSGESGQESHIYDVAARLACSQLAEEATGFALYEERITAWGRACILCSFEQQRLVEGVHPNCLQMTHRTELSRHRQGVKFKGFVGCFNCGHMEEICPRRGRTGGCMQPWLAWHVSWAACRLDLEAGRRMITLLGGPNVEQGLSPTLSWHYCVWLGQSHELFGHSVSNMGRLLHYWLDRLEDRCREST